MGARWKYYHSNSHPVFGLNRKKVYVRLLQLYKILVQSVHINICIYLLMLCGIIGTIKRSVFNLHGGIDMLMFKCRIKIRRTIMVQVERQLQD